MTLQFHAYFMTITAGTLKILYTNTSRILAGIEIANNKHSHFYGQGIRCSRILQVIFLIFKSRLALGIAPEPYYLICIRRIFHNSDGILHSVSGVCKHWRDIGTCMWVNANMNAGMCPPAGELWCSLHHHIIIGVAAC